MISPLKITVATVTYNAAAQIQRTIDSVAAQDYPFIEHVIVDGNSQDGTLAAIHHYQERNSVAKVTHEINCLSEPDNGLYDAMNKALEMATGHYIVFLNAGDTLHADNTLSSIASAITTCQQEQGAWPAVAYGDTDLVDANGHRIGPRRLAPPEHLTWKSFQKGMLVCHQAFYARTDLAKAHKYDLHYRFSADFDWCIRLMRSAASARQPNVHAHCVVADYLNEGMTTRHHKASLLERFHIMCRHYGLMTTLMNHIWFCIRKTIRP